MAFDKERLFKPRLEEAEIELPNVGTVRVRAMTRHEVMKVRKTIKSISDAIARTEELERQMLSIAMVDPVLTEDEVRQWQEASPAGEIDVVTNKVQELSGMLEGAAKEAYKNFDSNPDAEFRLPTG